MIEIQRTPGMSDAEYIELLEMTLRESFRIGAALQEKFKIQEHLLTTVVYSLPGHSITLTPMNIISVPNDTQLTFKTNDLTDSYTLFVRTSNETH